MVSLQKRIVMKIPSEKKDIELIVIYRYISFLSSSNNTPSSTPLGFDIKIKSVLEAKSNDELPTGIGDYSTYYPLIIDDDLNIGDMTL